MNWLLIIVAAIFLVCMVVGYIRGFIKIAASLGATIAILVLTLVLAPYTSKLLMKVTPIDDMIKQKCADTIYAKIEEAADLSGTPLEGLDLAQFGIDAKKIRDAAKTAEIPKQVQIELLEQADLPKFFREALLDNNNSEVYKSLGVDNFIDYIGAYLSKLIIDMIAYLVTFIVVSIAVRALIFAFDIIARLPVIGGFNRLAGALLGLVTGLVIVWTLFFVVLLLYSTSVGKDCMTWIAQEPVLTFLYENNLLLKWATAFK